MTIEEYWKYIFTDNNTDENKKIILIGPINNCIQYKRKLEELDVKKGVDYIYNNDLSLQGDVFEGIELIDIERLEKIKYKIIVVIKNRYDYEMTKQLEDMGMYEYVL